MTLSLIRTWEVQPGRTADFLDNQRSAAETQTRHGARRRLLRRMTGEAAGRTYSVVLEFDDWSSYAAFESAISGDQEWAARMQEAFSNTDQPARLVATNFVTDVTL